MDSLQNSYRLPASARTLCLRVRMAHAHGGPGENPEEIRAMADAVLQDGAPLTQITSSGRHGDDVWATFESGKPIVQAELNYTTDTGKWQDRNWQTIPQRLTLMQARPTPRCPTLSRSTTST